MPLNKETIVYIIYLLFGKVEFSFEISGNEKTFMWFLLFINKNKDGKKSQIIFSNMKTRISLISATYHKFISTLIIWIWNYNRFDESCHC